MEDEVGRIRNTYGSDEKIRNKTYSNLS